MNLIALYENELDGVILKGVFCTNKQLTQLHNLSESQGYIAFDIDLYDDTVKTKDEPDTEQINEFLKSTIGVIL